MEEKYFPMWRGKAINTVTGKTTDEWITGYYLRSRSDELEFHMIQHFSEKDNFIPKYSFVDRDTLGLCTGRKSNGKDRVFIFEGDIVKSVLDKTSIFVIGYGEHPAYCGQDGCWITNIGFYAEDEHGNKLPIGTTEEWAEIIGTVYDKEKS